jgi:hypothetical protein
LSYWRAQTKPPSVQRGIDPCGIELDDFLDRIERNLLGVLLQRGLAQLVIGFSEAWIIADNRC